MSIGFRDHEGFHRAAIAMAALGAAAGAAGHAIGASPLIAGAVGAAAGAAWAERPRRAARIGLGLALVAAGGALALIAPVAAPWCLAAATAMAIARGRGAHPRRTWLLAAAVGTLVVAAGAFAAGKLAGAALTATWPAWASAAAASGAMAFTAVVALIPRHVAIEPDPIAVAMRGLPAKIDAEARELAAKGAAVWGQVKDRLAADDAGRTLVRDGVLRLVDVAARSGKIPGGLADDAAAIGKRIEELDARLAAATDEVARAQYAEARTSLDDQRRYLDGIKIARERLLARMHAYLAALEKFRLAVIHHQATSTTELASRAEALAELEAA